MYVRPVVDPKDIWAATGALLVLLAIIGGLLTYFQWRSNRSHLAQMVEAQKVLEARLLALEGEIICLKEQSDAISKRPGGTFFIDDYVMTIPASWAATKISSNRAEIFDAAGVKRANVVCPAEDTGYGGWDFSVKRRDFTKNSISYHVEFWQGTPKPEFRKDVQPLALIFMNRGRALLGGEEHSCHVSFERVSGFEEFVEAIYYSVQ